jgi:ABC-type amino acid transport system permease subunit
MPKSPQNLASKLFQREIPVWRDERVLRIVAQIVSAIVIIAFFYWMVNNLVTAANQRGLSLGFRFLNDAAGFPIGESPVPYDPSNTFAYAFYVGLLNTIKVSVIGVILATLLGTIVGLARLSSNWLVNRLALTIHRNSSQYPAAGAVIPLVPGRLSQAARGTTKHRLARACIP